MSDPLIILDSEARAETLKSQLGGRVETWLVTTTPFQVALLSDTGVGPGDFPLFGFSPASDALALAAKLAAAADREVYLAFDNDQRGNYWAWMIAEYLEQVSAAKNIAKRLFCPGLTSQEIDRSLLAAAPVDRRQGFTLLVRTLLNSAFTTQLKRLIGTESGPGNLPFTVPSLTTLFLVNDRDREIASLKERPAWRLAAQLAGPAGEFVAYLKRFVGVSEDGLMNDESQARQVIGLMRRDSFVVKSVNRAPFPIPPPEPYRLITLLHDAGLYFGIPPARTLAAVQHLYDGVTMPAGRQGLVSSYLPCPSATLPTWYTKLLAEAGDFLFPLRPEITEDSLRTLLDEDAGLLYGLIRQRAAAGLLAAAQGETVEVEVSAGNACTFEAAGRQILEPGFLGAYRPPGESDPAGASPLAALAPGQKLACRQVKPEKIERLDTELYTLDSLLVDLAEFSVVPDSTTIAMLQQMLDSEYLRLDGHGHVFATERTTKVVATVNRAFPSMRNLNLTAYIEQLMQETLDGRKTLPATLSQFHQTINMHGRVLAKKPGPAAAQGPSREQLQSRLSRPSRNIIKAGPAAPPPGIAIEQPDNDQPGLSLEPVAPAVQEDESAFSRSVQDEPGGEAVPATDSPVLAEPVAVAETSQPAPIAMDTEVSLANQGEAPGQERTPEPGSVIGSKSPAPSIPVSEAVRESAVPARPAATTPAKPCPVCGRPLILKEDQYGKFLICSGFPACRHSEAFEESSPRIMECPVCQGGSLVMKRTPAGKDLYVCPDPGCDFVAWSKPHGVACPLCRSPYLVEKLDNLGQITLRCPRAGCGYIEPLAGAPADDSPVPARKKVLVRRAATGGGGGVRRVRVVKRK